MERIMIVRWISFIPFVCDSRGPLGFVSANSKVFDNFLLIYYSVFSCLPKCLMSERVVTASIRARVWKDVFHFATSQRYWWDYETQLAASQYNIHCFIPSNPTLFACLLSRRHNGPDKGIVGLLSRNLHKTEAPAKKQRSLKHSRGKSSRIYFFIRETFIADFQHFFIRLYVLAVNHRNYDTYNNVCYNKEWNNTVATNK